MSHTISRKGRRRHGQEEALSFSAELLDKLLEGQDSASVLRSDGLLGDQKKSPAARMLTAEMDVHLDS